MNFKRNQLRSLIVILAVIAIALSAILGISLVRQLTGFAIQNYYTYTKAICNDSNYCQDYEIVCNGNDIVTTNPINGAVVQNPEDWEDPRPEEERNYEGLCNISS
jgi:hypothetical protein